jgi:hypothetical protein
MDLSPSRRRLLGGALIAAVVVVLALLLIPRLPCEFPGGDACAPPDEAAELVPADAQLYAHANLERDGEGYARAAEIAESVPRFSAELLDRLALTLSDGRIRARSFEDEVRPWFGGELAYALLDAEEEVVLLEVAEGAEEVAADYADGLRKPARGDDDEPLEHEGTEISVDRAGLATAQVERFLAIGTPDGIRALIDTAAEEEGADSLAEFDPAREVRDELPRARLLELYASAEGADRAIAAVGFLPGPLAPLLGQGAIQELAVSLGADEARELELALRAELDSETADAADLAASLEPFEPALAARLPSQTLAYAGVADPVAVAALLGGELPDGVAQEAALTLQPAPGTDASEAPLPAPGALPERGFATAAEGVEGLRRALRRLGLSRTALLEPGKDRLAATDLYERAIDPLPERVSLLAFLDLDRLIRLGEGLGLAEDPVYAAVAAELRRLEALGLAVTAETGTLDADARLLFGE